MIRKTIVTTASVVEPVKDDLPFEVCSICKKSFCVTDMSYINDSYICSFCSDKIDTK
jgi:hypothetical protein